MDSNYCHKVRLKIIVYLRPEFPEISECSSNAKLVAALVSSGKGGTPPLTKKQFLPWLCAFADSLEDSLIDEYLRNRFNGKFRTETKMANGIPLLGVSKKFRHVQVRLPVRTHMQFQISIPAVELATGPTLFELQEWKELRYQAICEAQGRCVCCGRTAKDGVKITVDHILPRFTHPHLALDANNLQVLCEDCNKGKGSHDATDWRV